MPVHFLTDKLVRLQSLCYAIVIQNLNPTVNKKDLETLQARNLQS